MKKSFLAYAVGVALTASFLSGCQDDELRKEFDKSVETEVNDEAIKLSVAQTNKEAQEIKEFLARAKELDPTIVDAYYSVTSDGERVINIVREAPQEQTSGSSNQNYQPHYNTYGMSMHGSFVGTALANLLVPSNPSPTYYSSRARYGYYDTPDDLRKRRGSATASYKNTMVKKNVQAVKTSPTKMRSINNKITTSKPAFKSVSSSSRSGAYSGGRSSGFGG